MNRFHKQECQIQGANSMGLMAQSQVQFTEWCKGQHFKNLVSQRNFHRKVWLKSPTPLQEAEAKHNSNQSWWRRPLNERAEQFPHLPGLQLHRSNQNTSGEALRLKYIILCAPTTIIFKQFHKNMWWLIDKLIVSYSKKKSILECTTTVTKSKLSIPPIVRERGEDRLLQLLLA